jgi:hypothetical protein
MGEEPGPEDGAVLAIFFTKTIITAGFELKKNKKHLL